VEDVLGPKLLVWSTSFFIKEARDPAYVSWHQDATYWGLSEPDVLTAWVAFTEATVENGAMRMVPGSHAEQLAHRDTFAPHNLLSRGQEIAVEVDDARGGDVLLRPGEMALRHVRMGAEAGFGNQAGGGRAHGLRDPLSADIREADRGRARQRDARARRGRASALRPRVRAGVRSRARGARPPRGGRGAVGEDPLPR